MSSNKMRIISGIFIFILCFFLLSTKIIKAEDSLLEKYYPSEQNSGDGINYINSEGHYSFKLSNKWIEIPSSKIDEITKIVRETSGMESITYKTGFALKEPNSNGYPYILVQEHDREGATYAQFVKMYEDENILTEIDEQADKISALQGINYDKPYVDKEKKIFYMVFQMDVKNVGKVKGIQAKFLGAQKYIDIDFYSLESEYEDNLVIFNEIINSFKFDVGYNYLITNNDTKFLTPFFERIILSGVSGLFVGAIFGLLGIFGVFSKKNKKNNDSINEEIVEDNDKKIENKNIEEEKNIISKPIKIKRKMTFKLFKNKTFIFVLLGLFIVGFIFYWTQIRVQNIKKNCYSVTRLPRENERNLNWSLGKKWGLGEIGNSPRKPEYTFAQKMDWGWVYPDRDWGSPQAHINDIDRQNYLYDSCLMEAGIN